MNRHGGFESCDVNMFMKLTMKFSLHTDFEFNCKRNITVKFSLHTDYDFKLFSKHDIDSKVSVTVGTGKDRKHRHHRLVVILVFVSVPPSFIHYFNFISLETLTLVSPNTLRCISANLNLKWKSIRPAASFLLLCYWNIRRKLL